MIPSGAETNLSLLQHVTAPPLLRSGPLDGEAVLKSSWLYIRRVLALPGVKLGNSTKSQTL